MKFKLTSSEKRFLKKEFKKYGKGEKCITPKGEIYQSSMPNDIMNQVVDLIIEYLSDKNILFFMSGDFKISVPKQDMEYYYKAEEYAYKILISKGIITQEMIQKEFDNFLKS